jgi:hypothetical protein
VRWHARLCLDADGLDRLTAQTALAAASSLPRPQAAMPPCSSPASPPPTASPKLPRSSTAGASARLPPGDHARRPPRRHRGTGHAAGRRDPLEAESGLPTLEVARRGASRCGRRRTRRNRRRGPGRVPPWPTS